MKYDYVEYRYTGFDGIRFDGTNFDELIETGIFEGYLTQYDLHAKRIVYGHGDFQNVIRIDDWVMREIGKDRWGIVPKETFDMMFTVAQGRDE